MSNRGFLKRVSARFPEYRLTGRGLWAETETSIAHGLYLNPSSYNASSFTLKAVILPLAVNDGYVTFTFSKQLWSVRQKGLWIVEAGSEALLLDDLRQRHDEAEAFLAAGRSPATFCDWLLATGRLGNNDIHALGYYSIYAGRFDQAAKALEQASDELLKATTPTAWMTQRGNEIADMLGLLRRDPAQACAALDRRCREARDLLRFTVAEVAMGEPSRSH